MPSPSIGGMRHAIGMNLSHPVVQEPTDTGGEPAAALATSAAKAPHPDVAADAEAPGSPDQLSNGSQARPMVHICIGLDHMCTHGNAILG